MQLEKGPALVKYLDSGAARLRYEHFRDRAYLDLLFPWLFHLQNRVVKIWYDNLAVVHVVNKLITLLSG